MNGISFVILNYNDADTTIRLIESLLRWNAEWLSIVVVDNMSPDGSFTVLKEKYSTAANTAVIRSERNGGYSYGNNFGVKYAIEHFRPEYIVIANPDILVEYETVKRLSMTLDEQPGIAMIAPVMTDIRGNYSIYTQRLPEYKDDLRACFNSSNKSSISDTKLSYFNDDESLLITQMITGSFFMIRTKVLEDIDYLDEGVFLYCEERILGHKLAEKGYIAAIRTDLKYIHAHATSIKKAYSTVQSWKILMRSRYYYETKYNKINILQKWLLKASMYCFVFGLYMKLSLYDIYKRVKRK